MKIEVNEYKKDPWPILGLTGGIACGKTTAANFFKQKGIKIVDADKIAHAILEPKNKIYQKVLNEFPSNILDSNKQIDRRKLNELIFNDKKSREKLERILHPEILKEIDHQIKDALRSNPKEKIVLVAPLLFETGLEKKCLKSLVISSTIQNQMNRLKERDGFSENEAKIRIKSQMPLSQKEKKADWTIENNQTKEQFIADLESFYSTFWK